MRARYDQHLLPPFYCFPREAYLIADFIDHVIDNRFIPRLS